MKHSCSPLLVLALAVLAPAASGLRAADQPYAPLEYAPRGNVGQALVDMEMARHPELKLITLHVTPLGIPADSDQDRCILCSSIGRIGKPDVDEDVQVYRKGEESTELATQPIKGVAPWGITQAPKFEVLTPIYDQSGEKVGLAAIVFGYHPGDDQAHLAEIAHQIRDDIKARIKAKDDLLAPAS